MKAIVLAAGGGSRLGSLTAERPKCLVELAGRALLDWQLSALRGGGMDEIVLVGGYRHEMLEGRGCRVVVNEDWATTNMVASLLCAAEEVDGPVLVSYADIVYHPELVRRLAAEPHPLVVSYDRDWLPLWSARFEDPLSDAESFRLGEGNRITEIGSRVSDVRDIEGQYMGLFRITPDALGWIRTEVTRHNTPDGLQLDVTGLLSGLIESGRDVRAFPTPAPWCEVDSESDLRVAEDLVRRELLVFSGTAPQ